jgi:histidinol phosphatase-like enzyme
MLAIDFDKTLIDDDKGSSMSFENFYIRNQFFWLMKYLIQHKWIYVISCNQNLGNLNI